MANLNSINLPTISIKYPTRAVNLSSSLQTVDYDLKRTKGVIGYNLLVKEGTLTGGTSPAWAVTKSEPVMTHVKVQADNETLLDLDAGLLQEYSSLVFGDAPDGLHLYAEMVDRDYKTGHEFIETVFPSYQYNQIQMSVTFNTIANVTTGSPTAAPVTLYMSEVDIERADLVNAKVQLATVKKIQGSSTLSLTGDNDLTSFLGQTGAYKSVLYFVSTAQVSDGAYTSGTDSDIEYVDLILNDTSTIRSDYWQLMKNQNKNLFKQATDTGFAMQVFQNDSEISKLLNLADVQNVKSVNVKVNTSTNPLYLYAMKVLYVV